MALAAQPGSGWGVSEADLEAALQPPTFSGTPGVTRLDPGHEKVDACAEGNGLPPRASQGAGADVVGAVGAHSHLHSHQYAHQRGGERDAVTTKGALLAPPGHEMAHRTEGKGGGVGGGGESGGGVGGEHGSSGAFLTASAPQGASEPDTRTAGETGAAAALAAQQGRSMAESAAADVALSWPAFFNTALHIMNR